MEKIIVKSRWELENIIKNNSYPLELLDVSNITNMSFLFDDIWFVNGDISNWDVSNVEDMSHMFFKVDLSNQDISNWDVSNVRGMDFMFAKSKNFNQDISWWDMSKVLDISWMFYQVDNVDVSILDNMNLESLEYSTHAFSE